MNKNSILFYSLSHGNYKQKWNIIKTTQNSIKVSNLMFFILKNKINKFGGGSLNLFFILFYFYLN